MSARSVGLELRQNRKITARPVSVCILGTGVLMSHADLVANIGFG